MTTEVRARIAPSPTGRLHMGTARAALFNDLFAHAHGGKFIVRIEDTDQQRNKPEFEQDILEGLRWLGLFWDEGPDVGGDFGPYRQSERTAAYQEVIERLLAEKRAYQVEDGEAIKFIVEEGEITFTDLVRGKVTVSTKSWGGDFVIARSITDPIFHLVVVVDDAAMSISHVIRGEDHLSNTARHILIQRALNLPQPQYAHLPLLLDEQRRKLSKRTNEVSLLSYRDAGFLPEAMLNYLALLGWNPKNDQEFFTKDELIERFALSGVQKGGAIFSETKLKAFNKHYLRGLALQELFNQVRPFLIARGYDLNQMPDGVGGDCQDYWVAAVATEQERAATLVEMADKLRYFSHDWTFGGEVGKLVWRKSTLEQTRTTLESLYDLIDSFSEDEFKAPLLEQRIMTWIESTKHGRGDILWPMRVALTGEDKSPGPFEVAAILKKRATLKRIHDARQLLENKTRQKAK